MCVDEAAPTYMEGLCSLSNESLLIRDTRLDSVFSRVREIPCLTIEYSKNNEGARWRAAELWMGGRPSHSEEMDWLIHQRPQETCVRDPQSTETPRDPQRRPETRPRVSGRPQTESQT